MPHVKRFCKVFASSVLLPAAFAADAVDVALKVAAADELCEHILLEDRYRAGVEANLAAEALGERGRQDHIAHTHRRGDGLGKGIHVNDGLLALEGEERILALAGHAEFRVEVVLDDIAAALLCPAEVFAALARACGHQAREAVERRDVQHRRLCAGKLIRADAVAAEAQHLAPHALRLIDAADLVIRRVLQREHALAPQKLHDEPVEILRARADDDLPRLHADAARAGEVRRDGPAQFRAAVVR